jgi:hypothetical protein
MLADLVCSPIIDVVYKSTHQMTSANYSAGCLAGCLASLACRRRRLSWRRPILVRFAFVSAVGLIAIFLDSKYEMSDSLELFIGWKVAQSAIKRGLIRVCMTKTCPGTTHECDVTSDFAFKQPVNEKAVERWRSNAGLIEICSCVQS